MRFRSALALSLWFALAAGCSENNTGGNGGVDLLGGGGAGDDLSTVGPGADMSLVGPPPDLAGGTGGDDGGDDAGGSSTDMTSVGSDDGFVAAPDLSAMVGNADFAVIPCNQRCANGCCQGDSCLPAGPQVGCATNGAACQACGPDVADGCTNGACSCGGAAACAGGLACIGGKCQCTAKTCAGCCADATTCILNPSAAQCGLGGGACVNCAPAGNACIGGACSCNGGAPCSARAACDAQKGCICDNQSCSVGGQCTPVSINACGLAGGACSPCDPRKADHCDAQTGSCRCGANPACGSGLFCDLGGAQPVCHCDPTPKTGCAGCCSVDRLSCLVNQTDASCGIGGATCTNCQAINQNCIKGSGSCSGCAMFCTGQNNGCCAGNSCVTVGSQTTMTGCGGNGMACTSCDINADSCVAGACSCGNQGKVCDAGLDCISGNCVCDFRACPNGCCTMSGCQNISAKNCGIPGGACVACDANVADTCLGGSCSCGQLGRACGAGTHCVGGACVCDANSCPKGCCQAGLCLNVAFPGQCGKPGGQCMACDPTVTDTCDAGGNCACGSGPACAPGMLCSGGRCVCATNPCSTCATAAQAHSYVGCEYWPTITFQGAWSIFDFAVAVANPQMVPATVTVVGPNNFANTTMVPAGGLAKIYLPWVAALKGPDMDSCGGITATTASVLSTGGAYKLTSTVPVSVYQFSPVEYQGVGGPQGKNWGQCPGTVTRCNQAGGPIGCYSFTNDASLLLPTTAMTGSYRVTGMTGWTFNGQAAIGTFMSITGTAANTTVTLKLSATASVVKDGGNIIPTTPGGGMVTFTLNARDVAEVLTPPGAQYDLSGTLVSATQPVQVITGVQCIDNPATSPACDHLEESVFPAETLGKSYAVTVPTGPGGAPVGHTVRIYGNFANTNLTYVPPINGAPAVIQPGVAYNLGRVNVDFVVTGDQPFAVDSFMLGASIVDPNTAAPNQQGDPSETNAVAVEQYRTQYIFLAPPDYNVSYADIVVPTGTIPVLDGLPQNGVPVPIGNSGYGTLRIKLGAGNGGAHTLTAPKAVGLQVIGYGSYTSYMYPGGLDLTLISMKPVGG